MASRKVDHGSYRKKPLTPKEQADEKERKEETHASKASGRYCRVAKLITPQYLSGSSAGKESTCNAGDLGWEDLEEGMAAHSSVLAWRIPMDRGAWWATVHGVAKSQTQLSN